MPSRWVEHFAVTCISRFFNHREPPVCGTSALNCTAKKSLAIFDTFDDEAGREAHLNGKTAAGLMAKGPLVPPRLPCKGLAYPRKPPERAWPIVCRAPAAETAPSDGTVIMATWPAAAAVMVLVRVPA
jgi:hypothetical protein